MARLPGGRALVAALAACEVDVVFGVPGTHNLPVYAHLGAYGITAVTPRHEQAAGFAADGYARVTGSPGVVLTDSGPGVLQAMTAIAQAYSDSVPVLLISPGMPTDHPAAGDGRLHEVRRQVTAVEAVIGTAERVGSVAEIPVAVARAFAAMATGRAGPRHLEIPLDLLDAVADVEITAPVPAPAPSVEDSDVHRATELLGYARAPGIIAGGGARAAHRELAALAERLDAPVVTTAGGKGVLAEDHPLSLGAALHLRAAAAFTADCDVLVAVGTGLARTDMGVWPPAAPEMLIRVDVDPLQLTTGVPADLPVAGDATAVLGAVRTGLGPKPRRGGRHAVDKTEDRCATWRDRIEAEARGEGRRWSPLFTAVDEVLGRDGIFVGDRAVSSYCGALTNLPRYLPRTFLQPAGFGATGYGLPAAIGASLGWPGTRVMALHGDSGFVSTAAELATAARLKLPLPVVLVGDGGLREEIRRRGDSAAVLDQPPVDFCALASALGCHGLRTDDPDTLVTALEAACLADRPTLVHVEESAHR